MESPTPDSQCCWAWHGIITLLEVLFESGCCVSRCGKLSRTQQFCLGTQSSLTVRLQWLSFIICYISSTFYFIVKQHSFFMLQSYGKIHAYHICIHCLFHISSLSKHNTSLFLGINICGILTTKDTCIFFILLYLLIDNLT